ncbi:hypothetical protein PsAD2_00495 [Pseudovibrio axinellae]|uniref:YgjP-like metallopeptidase domain-containing protein n=1 Tax=Pseudovibrio axinellae TaxID=989403 RepID=A0A166AJR5_9HYPH|nr:SprT family zinc-dependent metalloprotease [Pseudovibrio axinellae]KZL21206.1 hypothetical protein PsAD2_00495 [Pseudovibrio axinellae]SEQ91933.1 hypothetical protein SAMN05421798_105118 [Pseudovibrio axinellae]
MSTNKKTITVSGVEVDVIRKSIKNLHLSVCPPDGKVKLSSPERFDDDRLRLAIISRLPWIRKRQEEFRKQPRQSERVYVDGESHFFRGNRYILKLEEVRGKSGVTHCNNAVLRMNVKKNTSIQRRADLLAEWYRQYLKIEVAKLLERWQPIVGRQPDGWKIQKMKTKWGSCNTNTKSILINLELAKKSPECLEYIVVHELVHLHERRHNDRFRCLMDEFLPTWRSARDKLKSEPLAHEDWEY